MLSLFWKRFNVAGAIAGIVSGAAVDIIWLLVLNQDKLGIVEGNALLSTLSGVYEIIPGAIISAIFAVVATLITKKPSEDVEKLFDKAVALKDE